MFDVNFSEILVILVVALIVIGPDRLPAVARAMGQWMGRIRRFVGTVKQDVNRSMELEELRELERKVKAEAAALEQSVQQVGLDVGREAQIGQKAEKKGVDPDTSTTPADDPSPPQRP